MNNLISILVLFSGIGLIGISFTNCGKSKAPITLKSQLDLELDAIISVNELTALSAPPAEDPSLVALGKKLFNEKGMSGLNDVSCASCHEPTLGSGDGLPLSLGSGANGVFPNRKQINGISVSMKRHSPSIFNKGRSTSSTHALWDGRLSVINGIVGSPVAAISGSNPSRPDIVAPMQNAFDLQPLFPMISPDEFLGTNNSLANLVDPVLIWDAILFSRLLIQTEYVNLFAAAFPGIASNNLSPGHAARAIGAFVKTQFLANDTPFDRYIAGDLHAMTMEQKLGMRFFIPMELVMFVTLATNSQMGSLKVQPYHSSLFPPFSDDLGREEATNNPADRYKFKVPNLRNVKLSAPYMHNGAFESLEQVVEHYSNVTFGINNYILPPTYQQHYDQVLVVDTDQARNDERIEQISDARLKNSLHLSPEDKTNLIEFLREGLTDTTFLSR